MNPKTPACRIREAAGVPKWLVASRAYVPNRLVFVYEHDRDAVPQADRLELDRVYGELLIMVRERAAMLPQWPPPTPPNLRALPPRHRFGKGVRY